MNANLKIRETILSPFPTRRRKEIFDFLANTIIFPSYFAGMNGIILGIRAFMDPQLWIVDLMWLFTILPVLNTIGSNVYWKMGFVKRKRMYTAGVIVLLYMIIHDEFGTVFIFYVSFILLLIEFMVRRLLTSHKFLANLLRPRIVLLTGIVTFLVLVFNAMVLDFPMIYGLFSPVFWVMTVVSFICIITLFPFYMGIRDFWFAYKRRHRYDTANKFLFTAYMISGILALGIFCRALFTIDNTFAVSLGGTTLMLLTANPLDIISRQKSNTRNLFKSLHERVTYKLVSYNASPNNFISMMFEKWLLFLKSNIHWILFMTAWLIGGIVFPALLYTEKIETNILILSGIGLLTSTVASVLFYISWLIQIRPKHIVIPFKTIKSGQDPSLEVIANLVTQSFVKQLKQVSLLLNLRQVENLSLRNNSGLAVFVSSEQNQELVEQVRSLGNIETMELKIPFGSVLSPILANLVDTSVRGTIQRQEDQTVAIWVEYQNRGGQIVNVAMAFLPENSARDLDESMIREITYALAVKLVFNLGQHSNIASSWESLRLFLDGINAAYHRNWWHAIACYQKAVHLEEAARSNFGYGYYHLGAMLLFQGEIEQGLKYLELAETVGPPLAETHYMLAVGRFYIYRDLLHQNRSVFADITLGCLSALRMRPDFPEAHHLIGTAYYQRGRLRERAYTRFYNKRREDSQIVDPVARGYADDYHKASFHFQKAIQSYDRVIRSINKDPVAQSTFIDEKARLVQDRMAASHRLADTLRCLERFSEADLYYQDVLYAFPKNSRTLIDQAKTYCLSENWGRADQFLRTEVLNQPELKWNKSASFYMGWTQIGGLAEEQDFSVQVIDWFIYLYERVGNRGPTSKSNRNLQILANAVDWLDFAYHEYPGYTLRWRQLDWLPSFNRAMHGFEKDCDHPQEIDEIYKSKILIETCNVKQLRFWLAWRILGLMYLPDQNTQNFANSITGHQIGLSDVPHEGFRETYDTLSSLRLQYYEQLMHDESSRSIKSIKRKSVCLRLGEQAFIQWKKAKQLIKSNSLTSISDFTFADRWALDIFSEMALMNIKLFTEAKAYEYANSIARETREILEKFVHIKDSENKSVYLGNKVIRYQLATLYAWEAFTTIEANEDIATKARVKANSEIHMTKLESVKLLVLESKSLVPAHPLAIYVGALNLKQLGLYREAADELITLFQVISPNNPHKYLAHETIKPNGNFKNNQSSETDFDLAKRERINGRLQFDFFINPIQIHISLASMFAALDELSLVVDHLMLAIGHCPYDDLSAELFLDLTRIFNQKHSYEEALTASEEAKNHHQHLSPFENSTIKKLEPFILECVLTTNLGDYSNALDKTASLKERIYFNDFKNGHQLLLDELMILANANGMPRLKSALRKYNFRFHKLTANPSQKDLNQLARLCLRPDLLAAYIKGVEAGHQDDLGGTVLGSQVIALLSRDIFEYIVFQCDIYNNSAFNWAELNINLSEAMEDAKETIEEMDSLFRSLAHANSNAYEINSGISKQVQTILDPLTRVVTSYDRRLANYIDTLAWVLFRKGGSNNLEEAYDMLIDSALLYDSGLAVIHYHISRICVHQIELTWQKLSALSHQNKGIPPSIAIKISKLLRTASLHLRHAQRMDSNQSLHTRIRILKERINLYSERWLILNSLKASISNKNS